MKYHYFKYKITLLLVAVSVQSFSQEANIKIDPSCQRFIGEVSELDRAKYFSIHDAGSDAEQTKFRNDYNVTGGRNFWGPYSFAKGKTNEVGVYPAYKNGDDSVRGVKNGYVATEHPGSAFKDGLDLNSAADWAAEYFKDFVDANGRNEYFEVMNEPFVHASDFYEGWNSSENDRIKLQMANFYNEVAKKIKSTSALSNMKVIGYSSAYPSVELNDFGQWSENMKMFMDTAGENMYGFSTHLYDGINVTGQDSKRSGSNSEAILDLIENYSFIKWGKVKPHAITEYGAIEKGYEEGVYSEIASSQTLGSLNHILFNLLDREDRLALSIPFITGKATWHITAANNYQPYGATLWIPSNIGEPNPTGWRYSPRIRFYELWQDVKGKRVLIKSDNPDVQVHAFLNNEKLFVALSNLDDNNQIAKLSMLSNVNNIESVKIKALKIFPQQMPSYTIETVNEAPESITLIKDETVLLEYTFKNTVSFDNALRSKNYYPANHLESITANTPINYSFNNVEFKDGYATLRMSIGRKHNVSKRPIVKVNNVQVEVPTNWKGYDQVGRDDFFGMIEIPFSTQLLKATNTISIEFPDSGGTISSLILAVELFDKGETALRVKGTSNSCPNQAKGIISIETLISDNYKVLITGEGLNDTYEFSNNFNIENLKSGDYTITITSTINLDFKEEYNIQISEPDNLSAKSSINYETKNVTYNLKGGSNYTINLNNKVYTTSKSIIELPLKNGSNEIKIMADKDCQGVVTENLFIGGDIIAYPNPFSSNLNIDLGLYASKKAAVNVFSPIGTLIYSKELDILNGKVNLDMAALNSGVYLLTVNTLNASKSLKIIKN